MSTYIPQIDPSLANHPTSIPNLYMSPQIRSANDGKLLGAVTAETIISAQLSVNDGSSMPATARQNAVKDFVKYGHLSKVELQSLCSARNLSKGGNKKDLILRLENNDASDNITDSISTPEPQAENLYLPNISDNPVEIDSERLNKESEALGDYFDSGMGVNDGMVEDESDDEDGREESVLDPPVIENESTHTSMEYVDNFILSTRRSGGRQTEISVIKQWKAWASVAITAGTINDIIIDSTHLIEYLKYAATRQLFSRRKNKSEDDRLSASSLKKIMTMLGRVRRRQEEDYPSLCKDRPAKTSRTTEFYRALMVQAQRLRFERRDFDLTTGTILDSRLQMGQLEEVTASIFQLPQLPSIIKSYFAWNWQCATLNRSDDVISLLMSCIHPYEILLPEYTGVEGYTSTTKKSQFGVLAMWFETKVPKPGKTKPEYSFVLPHRNPLRCPVGALAILLHYMFDNASPNLISRVPQWDWSDASTWRQIHVMFGRNVDDQTTSEALGKMYNSFLKKTSIKSDNVTHFPRKEFGDIIVHTMNVPADQCEDACHHAGTTRQENYSYRIPAQAIAALAGFAVGEEYQVPWVQVEVPDELQRLIFPFCEDVIANLQYGGCTNKGTFNFLNLLKALRPFFWRAIAAINLQFESSAIIKRLNVLSNEKSKNFLHNWPSLVQTEESKRSESFSVAKTFQEAPTRNAFTSVSSRLDGIQKTMEKNNQHMDETREILTVLKRRTEHMSPSKRPNIQEVNPNASSHFGNSPTISTTSKPQSPSVTANKKDLSGPLLFNTPIPSSAGTRLILRNPDHLVIDPIMFNNMMYHVLRLSPPSSSESPPIQTAYDLILPVASAFDSQAYPIFTTTKCTWQYVFENVTNPSELWLSYAPGNLGDYADIKSIWEAWDEGTFVTSIGRKAPIRLIDARWGNLKNEETHRKKYASWRRNLDTTGRKVWSNFFFFIERIENRRRQGYSPSDAVLHFENLREGRSLSQFHRFLQPKRKRALDDVGKGPAPTD